MLGLVLECELWEEKEDSLGSVMMVCFLNRVGNWNV